MKKVVATLFAICILVTANAQIQKQFFGLEIGKNYSSFNQVVPNIKDRSERVYMLDEHTLVGSGCRFGGYDWDFSNFCFAGAKRGVLYEVCFTTTFDDNESAQNRCKSLKQDLINKYGTPTINDYGSIRVYKWERQSSPVICRLSLSGDLVSVSYILKGYEFYKLDMGSNNNEL